MKKFKFKEKLTGSRITLKKHELSLAKTMFDYVQQDSERLDRFLPWVQYIKTVEDEENYIKSTHDKWEDGTLFDYGIFNEDNIYIGNIGVHTLRFEHDRGELGYWILGEFEGKGYMTEAVRTLEKYMFEEGFNRIQIRCSDLNERSANVPIRCGYIHEGTMREDAIEKGAYRNTKMFSKLCSEYIKEIGEPLVRRARALDSAGVIKAHVKSIKELCAKDYSPKQISAWSDRDFKESIWRDLMQTNHIWVIDDGNCIQGFCDFNANDKEIRGLYITPEVIGKGLGKALLNKALEVAKRKNIAELHLSATKTAYQFYLSQGFVGDQLKSVTINNESIDSYSMSKKL